MKARFLPKSARAKARPGIPMRHRMSKPAKASSQRNSPEREKLWRRLLPQRLRDRFSSDEKKPPVEEPSVPIAHGVKALTLPGQYRVLGRPQDQGPFSEGMQQMSTKTTAVGHRLVIRDGRILDLLATANKIQPPENVGRQRQPGGWRSDGLQWSVGKDLVEDMYFDGVRVFQEMKDLMRSEKKYQEGQFQRFFEEILQELRQVGFSDATIKTILGGFSNQVHSQREVRGQKPVKTTTESARFLLDWLKDRFDGPVKYRKTTAKRRRSRRQTANPQRTKALREQLRWQVMEQVYGSLFQTLVQFSERLADGSYGTDPSPVKTYQEFHDIFHGLRRKIQEMAQTDGKNTLCQHSLIRLFQTCYEAFGEIRESEIQSKIRANPVFQRRYAARMRVQKARQNEQNDQVTREMKAELVQLQDELKTMEANLQRLLEEKTDKEQWTEDEKSLQMRHQTLQERIHQFDQEIKDRLEALSEESYKKSIELGLTKEMRQEMGLSNEWKEEKDQKLAEVGDWKLFLTPKERQQAERCEEIIESGKPQSQRVQRAQAQLTDLKGNAYHFSQDKTADQNESPKEQQNRQEKENIQRGRDLFSGLQSWGDLSVGVSGKTPPRWKKLQAIVGGYELGPRWQYQLQRRFERSHQERIRLEAVGNREDLAKFKTLEEKLVHEIRQIQELERRIRELSEKQAPAGLNEAEILDLFHQSLMESTYEIFQGRGDQRLLQVFPLCGHNRQAAVLLAHLALDYGEGLVQTVQEKWIAKMEEKTRSAHKENPRIIEQVFWKLLHPKPVTPEEGRYAVCGKPAASAGREVLAILKSQFNRENQKLSRLDSKVLKQTLIESLLAAYRKARCPKGGQEGKKFSGEGYNEFALWDEYIEHQQNPLSVENFIGELERQYESDPQGFRQSLEQRARDILTLFQPEGQNLSSAFVYRLSTLRLDTQGSEKDLLKAEDLSTRRAFRLRKLFECFTQKNALQRPPWLANESPDLFADFVRYQVASLDAKYLKGKEIDRISDTELVELALREIADEMIRHEDELVRHGLKPELALKRVSEGLYQGILQELASMQMAWTQEHLNQNALIIAPENMQKMMQESVEYRNYEIRHIIANKMDRGRVVAQVLFSIKYPITRNFDFQVSAGADLARIERWIEINGYVKIGDSHNHPFSLSTNASDTDINGYEPGLNFLIWSMGKNKASRRKLLSIARYTGKPYEESFDNSVMREIPVWFLPTAKDRKGRPQCKDFGWFHISVIEPNYTLDKIDHYDEVFVAYRSALKAKEKPPVDQPGAGPDSRDMAARQRQMQRQGMMPV